MAQKNSTSRKRIAEMMEILRITQADIVKRTGIPKSTLSNYLSGKRTPDQEHLSVLSDPYGINPITCFFILSVKSRVPGTSKTLVLHGVLHDFPT